MLLRGCLARTRFLLHLTFERDSVRFQPVPSGSLNVSLQVYVLSLSWTLPSSVFFSHMSPVWLSVIVPSPLSTKRVFVQPLVSNVQPAPQESVPKENPTSTQVWPASSPRSQSSFGSVLRDPWTQARKGAPHNDGVYCVEVTVVVHVTGDEIPCDGHRDKHGKRRKC